MLSPVPLQLKALIKVKLSHGYPNNYEQIIKEALITHIDSLQINKTIEYTELICILNSLRFNFIFTEVKIGKKDEDNLKTENIELKFTEMAVITAENITVEKAQ